MRAGKSYGYVSVSTKEQNEERQLIAMRAYGLRDDQLVIEKQSGKDFDRPKYRRLLKKLKPGDSLVVKSIDRLGRNYEEILEQWRNLTKERQVNLIVLDIDVYKRQQIEGCIPFSFQLDHGFADALRRKKQTFTGLADGACFCYFLKNVELFQSHSS